MVFCFINDTNLWSVVSSMIQIYGVLYHECYNFLVTNDTNLCSDTYLCSVALPIIQIYGLFTLLSLQSYNIMVCYITVTNLCSIVSPIIKIYWTTDHKFVSLVIQLQTITLSPYINFAITITKLNTYVCCEVPT